MHLTGLRLAHFRNLAPMEIETPPEGAVLQGANGQGKTNFLEAIHFLARFRSFRGTPVADAIAFDADHFRVEGGVAREDGSACSVAVASDRESRRIMLDGRRVTPARAAGALLAVLWAPEDLALAAGSPVRRRAYLDGALSVISRRYHRALGEYDRALRQRNEALRSEVAEAELATWDQALIAAGTPLVAERSVLVARLGARFAEVADAIAGGGDRTDYALAYAPSVPVAREAAGDEAAVAGRWQAALSAERGRDRARGWTGVGPHRDEMVVELGSRLLARFGSQGERRTAAIALRLLEADVVEQEVGSAPLLLLDDVFSELDEGRGARLFAWLDRGARRQRFVTTPRPLAWLDGSLRRWHVACGRLETGG